MADVQHSTLTDPQLHEPKGISSAGAGHVYLSDGVGSGEWKHAHRYVNGFIPFNIASTYNHSVTTDFTGLNPTFGFGVNDGFTGLANPAGIKYVGTESIIAHCTFVCNYKNAAGSRRDVEFVFYRNGAPMNGGHVIVSAESNTWSSLTLTDMVQFDTNDYMNVYVKGESSFTLEIAAGSVIIKGLPL